jgi:RNA-splicing ligase RtcB
MEFTNSIAENIPKELAWLNIHTQEGTSYWEALQYSERWTIANHNLIHNEALKTLGIKEILRLGNAHNFVWKKGDKILHGKGATPAWKDDLNRRRIGIIPLNMASEILLTFGNNQDNYLSFSPHGAGRNKSRTKTLEPFIDPKTKEKDTNKLKESINNQTKGLDIRWASNRPDISESPLGYKSAKEVKKQIEKFGLADIAAEIAPKGCIMAGEFEQPWITMKKKKKSHKIEEMEGPM